MFNERIVALLRAGLWMGKDGSPSWALRLDQLQALLDELLLSGVPILGGDVYVHSSGVFRSAHMDWYSEPRAGQPEEEFAQRSVSETREYLKSIAVIADKYLYVPVLGPTRAREYVRPMPDFE